MGRSQRAAALGTAFGLFGLALIVRARRWPVVFGSEGVEPHGHDAFYHLRRVAYTLANFPASLDFDRYINFPSGAHPIWTPVLDWVLAALARPFAAPDDPTAMERWIVWAPPLIGAATVLLLHRLGRRHFAPAVGVLAAGLLAVLPGASGYARLGFVDHHVAVAFTGILCLSTGMAFLAPGGATLRRALALGAALAVALLVWPGSLLHVAVVEAFSFAAIAVRGGPEASGRIRALGWANALALVLVLPFTWNADWPNWGAASPVVLSRFQPWLFGMLGALALCCAQLWARSGLGDRAGTRLASGAVAAGVLLALCLVALPELLGGAEDMWRWLMRRERFQIQVSESEPLFVDAGVFTFHLAFVHLTPFFLAVPLALLALAREARQRDHDGVGLAVAWAAAVCAVAVLQRRFANCASIAVALLLAWSVWRVARGRAFWAHAALAVGLAVLLVPSLRSYQEEFTNLLRVLGGGKWEKSIRDVRHATAVRTARWIRHHTPPTSGWLDASVQPEYAVLAPWALGHIIEYVARRPTVVDNFGDDLGTGNFERAELYFRSTEPAAAAILEELGVRYVVAIAAHLRPRRWAPWSMQAALAERYGTEADGHPALERHRLLYESDPMDPQSTGDVGVFNVYEFVRGAVVGGRAAPGERIEATLSLRTNRGRDLVYRTSVVAGDAGRYVLRLPYATEGGPPAVRSGAAYVVSCGREEAPLPVAEEAVQGGAEVAGPALCAGPPEERSAVGR